MNPMVITLSGGDALAGFQSFSVRAVSGFNPTAHGMPCLCGRFLRVDGERTPPMNAPTPYALPSGSHALYVFGRSARGDATNFHAPLVPEAGSRVDLLLSDAPLQADAERITRLFENSRWTFARTMPANPHEYTQRRHWDDADFTFAVGHIRRWGRRERYGKGVYTVLDVGGHKTWTMGWPLNNPDGTPCTILINRKPLLAGAVPIGPQMFTALDARLLETPELPDGFAGLPTVATRCRIFRWAASMFGYPHAQDLRPRLLKRPLRSAQEV